MLGEITARRHDSHTVTGPLGDREFVGIVGPSGAGKTTALRVLAGSMRPAPGSVKRRAGLRMAYVPQVETINGSFPVTVRECVLTARVAGRRLPWAVAPSARMSPACSAAWTSSTAGCR